MHKKDSCTGDGATSENNEFPEAESVLVYPIQLQGDLHASLNSSAVMEAPAVHICRNNGRAISTHVNQ
ncbi:hypothetical protein SAY86_004278 [Trapa natans]|uniref:Dehydrogenase E1 component domain-containing protein n=1 Tax=Trapa natans TaxID=22666 RepID=A0AAN7MIB3_TRANT|nr:hypothetical protein SAY86_004278 [Trapa natans]